MTIDLSRLFEEAKVLSSYEHLAAVFECTVDDLAQYRSTIERARKVSEHEFMSRLKQLMESGDKQALLLWAEVTRVKDVDKSTPITADEQMTSEKAAAILKGT